MNHSMPGSLSITNAWSLSKLMSIKSAMPSNHLILCHPLLLLPSIFSSIRVFSYESALRIRWSKYWSFGFNISPSNEYPGLMSFRMDWLDLLAVQRTLKSLLQHHSSKASILQHSAFFMVQHSHPYMTTGKSIVLTRWTFVEPSRDAIKSTICTNYTQLHGFPGGSVSKKKSTCSAGDPGSILGFGRSLREENGNPLQYSCLGNFMDRGAWQVTAPGVTRIRQDFASI